MQKLQNTGSQERRKATILESRKERRKKCRWTEKYEVGDQDDRKERGQPGRRIEEKEGKLQEGGLWTGDKIDRKAVGQEGNNYSKTGKQK